MLTKIVTKLNKNNKYRGQIEYKTLILTRGTVGLACGHLKK